MKIQNWMTINNRGSARLTKQKPRVDWNEVTMLLSIEIPDSVFKRPQLQANIKIDGELNYEFDYEITEKLENVLQTMPNVHLLKVDVVREKIEEEEPESQGLGTLH